MNWDWLFDTPWWLPGGLVIVGIAVWMSGNKRRDKTLLNVAYAVIALSAVIAAVSYFVVTPREKAEADTRDFVAAVVDQNLDLVREILEPRAHLNVLGGSNQYVNREQIVAATDRADDLFGLTSATVSGLRSQREGSAIIVTFDVLSIQQATMDRPLPTNWEFEYQQRPEGWKLWRITLVKLYNLSADQAERQFPVLPKK